MHNVEIEDIEISLLLEALYQRYGYDFRNYAHASIKRRIQHHLSKTNLNAVSELIPRVLYDEVHFQDLMFDLSITVTEMFRDPSFYLALRKTVIPFLKTFPFLNVWHAGCSTGEEVYSLAILLKEEDLYDQTRIYATDFNEIALKKANSRIYPMENIKGYTLNYQKAGGKRSLSEYYHAQYDSVIFDQALQRNVIFTNHNLVTDGVFAEMHLILCRNVLIYFDKALQNRVLTLFRDSLCHNGFLALGAKESLLVSSVRDQFVESERNEKIYQYKGIGRSDGSDDV